MRLRELACSTLIAVGMLPAAASAQDTRKPALSDFTWLTGRWVAQMPNGGIAEETFSTLAGGLISSMFRVYQGDKTMVLELCTLTEGKDGVELRIRHFDTALTPWEKGEPIVLRLTSWDGKVANFENFVHSRPKYNKLTRTGPDDMEVNVVIINDDGTERRIDLKMKRER